MYLEKKKERKKTRKTVLVSKSKHMTMRPVSTKSRLYLNISWMNANQNIPAKQGERPGREESVRLFTIQLLSI